MRLAILGSTGGTGRQLVTQALQRGHDVIALARRPDAVERTDPRLEIRQADVRDTGSLTAALAGVDAVISALGVNSVREMMSAVTLYSESGEHLVAAMEAVGARRLLVVTSGGVEHDDPSFGFVYRWLIKPLLLSRAYADMARLEARLAASSLDWTAARPSALTDDPRTGTYRVSPRLAPEGGTQISRADLADFLLNAAEQQAWIRGTPTLAY